MQLRFQNHPEFMMECSLFDIIPPDTVSVEKLQQLQRGSVLEGYWACMYMCNKLFIDTSLAVY